MTRLQRITERTRSLNWLRVYCEGAKLRSAELVELAKNLHSIEPTMLPIPEYFIRRLLRNSDLFSKRHRKYSFTREFKFVDIKKVSDKITKENSYYSKMTDVKLIEILESRGYTVTDAE